MFDTSSTASVNKVGMDIESTGTWSGTSAVNTGLVVNATGGTTNYAATFSGGNVGIRTTSPGFPVDIWNTPSPATNTVFEVADAAAGAFENSAQFIAPNMITGSERSHQCR